VLALCSPALGADWWSTSEECYRVESQFSHFDEALVALIASSLQLSAPDWSCFRQSAHSTTAPLLYGLFMLFVVILLLNMLIAMMAETSSHSRTTLKALLVCLSLSAALLASVPLHRLSTYSACRTTFSVFYGRWPVQYRTR
jgi:hypothetical protein